MVNSLTNVERMFRGFANSIDQNSRKIWCLTTVKMCLSIVLVQTRERNIKYVDWVYIIIVYHSISSDIYMRSETILQPDLVKLVNFEPFFISVVSITFVIFLTGCLCVLDRDQCKTICDRLPGWELAVCVRRGSHRLRRRVKLMALLKTSVAVEWRGARRL